MKKDAWDDGSNDNTNTLFVPADTVDLSMLHEKRGDEPEKSNRPQVLCRRKTSMQKEQRIKKESAVDPKARKQEYQAARDRIFKNSEKRKEKPDKAKLRMKAERNCSVQLDDPVYNRDLNLYSRKSDHQNDRYKAPTYDDEFPKLG